MIEIGYIAYGPELRRKPIVREIGRLRDALGQPESPPLVELAFVIPGRIGGPDFEGFKLGRRQGGERRPIVFIAVPPSLAASDEPMAALIDLMRRALELARPAPGRTERLRLRSALEEAASAFGVPALGEGGPQDGGRHARASSLDAEAHAVAIEVTLVLDGSEDLDRAFALEAVLDEELRAAGLGYVDGNEVGDGEFVIFTYGPKLPELREAVKAAMRARWRPGGAVLRLFQDDEEAGTLTL